MIARTRMREAGTGPALVFLHGWTMDGGLFENQFRRLSDRFHCLAPDLPGHGSAHHLPATLDEAAETVRQIINDRADDKVTLVGWSMGAATAWRYVACYGTGWLSRLMTVDMSPKIVNENGWTLGLKNRTPEQIAANTERFRTDWPGSAGSIAAGMFATREGPPWFDATVAEARIRKTDPDAMNAMWTALTAMDERATIPDIDIPYLVSHGALSRAYPSETADWLAKTAPLATKHVFASSGHSPHLEEPDEFARAVAAFVLSDPPFP